jgi:hypothetical protein
MNRERTVAINWQPPSKAKRVDAILAARDYTTGLCVEAAAEIHPLAAEQDPHARFLLVRPHPKMGPVMRRAGDGRAGILPNRRPAPKWSHHVSVETQDHCVCALTGSPGHETGGEKAQGYIARNFQYTVTPDGRYDPNVVVPIWCSTEQDLSAKLDVIG